MLGLIAWIFLASVAIVFSAEIDVVRYKRLYPRSLLTPFTDNVELTRADRRTYTEIAAAQQYKEFETVTVSFADERNGVASRGQPDAVDGRPSVQSPARGWKPRTPPSAPSNWSP